MLKRKTAIGVIAALVVVALCLLIDFKHYTHGTKTMPLNDSGIVFSITTFNGKTETEPFIKCLGHTWLSIENKTGHSIYLKDYEIENLETLTFSIWAISNHQGIFYNLEGNFINKCNRYLGRKSLSTNIDESKLEIIEEYLENNDKWTLGKNCSHWSIDLWNTVVDEKYHLKTQILVYTPKRLEKSFDEFDCVEKDKEFLNNKGIFFYKDGVRTELELCS